MAEENKELWALVELFGHQRIAGKVTEGEIGNGNLIRVDVPAVKGREPLTKYFNVKSLYAITPVTEATAIRMAADIDPSPVSAFAIERLVEKAMENRAAKGIAPGSDNDSFEEGDED